MTQEQTILGLDPRYFVHNSVYRDEELFEQEQRRIFGRVWNFVGHESEWRESGDYIPVDLAGNPVVVVRGQDDQLRAFYNVCRHRGAMLVDEAGHAARLLRCQYHWWTYNLEGELEGVPDRDAYEATGFCKEDFGLVPVRLQSYLGLVFVCLDPKAPTLEEFLGDEVLKVLEAPLAHSDMELATKRSFSVEANWKLVAENARDAYHVPFVHPLFRSASPPRRYELPPSGHAIQWSAIAEDKLPADLRDNAMAHTLPGLERGTGFFIFVFPDLILMARNNFFMISSSAVLDRQHTRVERRVLSVVGDTDEQRETRLLAARAFALDSYEDEDVPILELQSRGLQNTGVPMSVLARGLDADTGMRGDDNRLRQWWAVWRSHIGVDHNCSPSKLDQFHADEMARDAIATP